MKGETDDRPQTGRAGLVRAVERARRRAIYEAKTLVAQHPAMALPVARRRHGFVVERGSDIVIEGFPRSANTFAHAAFVSAQPESIRAAGRVHAPAQIIAAVRWGIPAIVLIRHPEDVVPSFLIRHPQTGVRQAMRGWLRFYVPLVRYLDRVVVAPFDRVTTDFGAVIQQVNGRFGTTFAPFEHTEESVAAVWASIDSDYRTRVGAGSEFDRIVARPSEGRERLREEATAKYRDAELTEARARLRSVWERFMRAAR
jgi:hypothetical protein